MRSPKLAALELKRFGRGKLPRAALVAILLLPLLYGALYLYSFWDPYSRLDKIPVALVNEDRGATADGKPIHAGDDITKGLLESNTFAWHQVSDAEAREGVENGTYYLSLTMPGDFSSRIASSSGDSPETGALRVRTNDANNYIVGQISRTVFSEVRTAASTKSSRTFLDKIFISFSDIHDATAKAAKGAGDLKQGVDKAKKGSKDLADGLKTAKTGSGDLAAGLKKLDKGAKDLESGSRKVANGTQALADKVNGTADKVRPYLANNGKSIRDTARLVSDSATAARHNLDDLVKRAPLVRSAAHKADDGLAKLHREACVTDPAPDAKVCEVLKEASVTAGDVATIADDVHELTKGNTDDLKTLDARLAKLVKQADELAARAPHLDEDVEGAIRKINELNAGAKKVAAGADRLHTGITEAKTGSVDLDTGVGKLKKGAGDLDGGLFKLADGSGTLATGLKDGVAQIPDYDRQDRDRRTEVMADPVRLASQSLHKAPNYGTGFAPYFIPLSLWVGAMVAYMIIQPLNRRLRLADRAGGLAAGGGDRRPPGRGPDVGPALGPRPPDGQGRRHGRLPRPGHLLLRRDHPVAQRPLRRGRPDPGPRGADAPADLGGRHLPRSDESGLLQRRPPVPADDLRGRGAAPADHGRRDRPGVAGLRGPDRVHPGRPGPDRRLGPQAAGLDARPAPPRTDPVRRGRWHPRHL